MSAGRRAELADRLARVRERVDAACAAAGRDPRQVRLLAVTKGFPASDVALLADLGFDAVGESRDREAARKITEIGKLHPASVLSWEMVGQVQRNKARSVGCWASTVQSVDSARLADSLDRAAGCALERGQRTGPLAVLLQAGLGDDPARGGCAPDRLDALADEVAAAEHLALTGVMGIAPLDADPDRAFARLQAVAARLHQTHPAAVELSAGMSNDLEAAIRHGSTCVRVGTALLGDRPLTSPTA